ncbi:FAD-dependent oxidoreductase [Candidatus Woesearchaeota archaeon]|nr:FAD-dependent oxidoreductase [Candidatus Woesearchaeota archaeon]
MEKYDVIIVGAGIAGCGLAYNLGRRGYKKKILVIDEKEIAANRAHRIKTVFKKIIKEYNLPYYHKYKTLVFASYEDQFKIECEPYSVDYEDACHHLLKNSQAEFKIEKAIDLNSDSLITNKNKYRFNLLVDCSGRAFFVRKKFNLPTSNRFWLAKLMIAENNNNIKTDCMYWLTDVKGYFEEFCPYKDHIAIGDYQYTNKIDFNLIKPAQKLLRHKFLKKLKIIKQSRGIIPNSPHFPLFFKKKFLFLGDSFGNSPTSSAYGSDAILETSKMLSYCIVNNCLHKYEKMWKTRYLESYIRYLALKYDLHHNSAIIKKIKNYPEKHSLMKFFMEYPEMTLKYLKDPGYVIKVPKEFLKKHKSPFIQKVFRLYYYLLLHTRAYLESLRRF